ncbi:MAG TPA: polymer-forming cytoskeletal protein [Blastocatellia bacterium]|nr:polymer-forming cytoskeletal protein [Blastocatellia bacterium]
MRQPKSDDYAIIGQGVEVSGQILFSNQLNVDGKVTGKITSETGVLTVGETGEVEAQVDIGVCKIDGTVHGDISARTRIEIHRTGKVHGDLVTPALLIEEGAEFNGAVKMSHEEPGRVTGPELVLDEVTDKRKIKGA